MAVVIVLLKMLSLEAIRVTRGLGFADRRLIQVIPWNFLPEAG
jgi:hypothetical protein